MRTRYVTVYDRVRNEMREYPGATWTIAEMQERIEAGEASTRIALKRMVDTGQAERWFSLLRNRWVYQWRR